MKVLASGQVWPLTAEQSKPAVPFVSRYCIIDFVLSNLVNSEIYGIYLLIQYKFQSLIERVNKAGGYTNGFTGQFITLLFFPTNGRGRGLVHGTSDAMFQNINLIKRHAPDMVAVFGTDHICRIDIRQMIGFHSQCLANVSVAPLNIASSLGIIDSDIKGLYRI